MNATDGVDAIDGMDLVDPRTGRPRRRTVPARSATVTAAVLRAAEAGRRWRGLVPRDRARRLEALAALIEEHRTDYVAHERAATGKPEAEAGGEVDQAIDLFRFFAHAARASQAPAAGHLIDGHESWVRWEPLGVVAAILPWNYPMMMCGWRCGPALAAGNAVVVKPAETTPDTAELLAEHADEALGSGVLSTVTGDRETGRLLVESDVQAVAFTGSPRAGGDVVVRAGLRAVSLELGGNAPVLVLPDAPGGTWEAIADATLYNAGQSCAAPARVITLRENHDEAVERLSAVMAGRAAGTDFGPLNNPGQMERFDDILNRSRAKHARSGLVSIAPGERAGFWRAATVLAELPPDDPAVVEEVFGPVLTVQAADGLEHAVTLANGVPQALAAGVWSRDLGTAMRLARQIDAGEVWLNCHLAQSAELPHGGRRASGHGTDLSELALGEYRRPKTITTRIAETRGRQP